MFPFSSVANTQVKGQLSTNPLYDISFLNVTGGSFTVSAAADSQEFGSKITVTAQGTFTVDFSQIPQSANSLGLSFVPLEGITTFTFNVSPHVVTSSSTSGTITSSSSGEIITAENRPNSLTVFSIPLEEDVLGQLFNENTNLRCENNLTSINIVSAYNILSEENSFDNLILNRFSSSNPNYSALIVTPSDLENLTEKIFSKRLENTTNNTQIYITAIFPSILENTMATSPDLIATINQKVISEKINLKATKNGGFYNFRNDECLSPHCAFIDNGKILFSSNGSCIIETPTKKFVTYKPFILSDFFSELPTNAKVSKVEIDLPTVSGTEVISMITSTNIIKERAHVIFQVVPSKTKIRQVLTITLAEKKKRQCKEIYTGKDGYCGENNVQCISKEFFGKCCEANPDGTIKRNCNFANAFTCNCTENFADSAFVSSTSAKPEEDEKPRKCPKQFLCGGCKNNGECCLSNEKNEEVARCKPTPFVPGMCSCEAI